jgi:hypothetical protein
MLVLLTMSLLPWLPLLGDVSPIAAPPIELDSCEYMHNHTNTKFGLRVRYVNVSATPAVMVRFHATWGDGSSLYLRDVGSFAQDVTIEHTFPGPPNELYGFGFTCAVTSARFADGSMWTAPVEDQ